MTATDTSHIAELVAKQAITEALHSYCRGLDRMERRLAERVWHSDGTADYGPGYRGTGSGFLDFVFDFHLGFENHSHMVTNTIIDVDIEARTATSESYVAVWLRTAPVDGAVTDQFHRGRYADCWSERLGVWAIDHRVYIGDMFLQTQNAPGPGPEVMPLGRRDRDDLSYGVLA